MKKGTNIGKIVAVLGLLFAIQIMAGKAYAQEDPVYSQYMNNLQSVNPAYTGVRDAGSFSSIYRKQWLGLDIPVETSSFTLSLPGDSLHTGFGFDFMYDYIDPVATLSLYFDYAYRIKLNNNSHLSLGIKGGMNYLSARLSKLYRHDENDPYIIEYGDFDRYMPNVGVGLFWYTDKAYLGFSIPRMLQNKFNDQENTVYTASREERTYFIQGATMIPVAKDIVFKPAFSTIMTAGQPITADLDLSFMFKDAIWFGAMYRISDAVGAYMQVQYYSWKIGIAYDYTHTRLKDYENGTFEVLLRLDFKTKKHQSLPSHDF